MQRDFYVLRSNAFRVGMSPCASFVSQVWCVYMGIIDVDGEFVVFVKRLPRAWRRRCCWWGVGGGKKPGADRGQDSHMSVCLSSYYVVRD